MLSSLFTDIYHTYTRTGMLIARHWKKFLPLILIPAALNTILTISTRLAMGNAFAHMTSFESLFSLNNLNSIVVALLLLCSVLVEILAVIAIIYMATQHENATVFHAIEASITYLWRFVAIGIIVFIISLFGLILGFIPVWIIGFGIAFINTAAFTASFAWIEYIASAVSALAAACFVFAPYVMIAGNTNVSEALHASFTAVRRRPVYVIGSVALLALLGFILTYSLLYVPRIGSLLSLYIIAPFSTIYIYLLYTQLSESSAAAAATEKSSTPTDAPAKTEAA